MNGLSELFSQTSVAIGGSGAPQTPAGAFAEAMVREFRKQLLLPARDASFFVAQNASGSTTVAAGALVIVASFRLSERYAGGLLGVGVNVVAPGSFSSIAWTLRSQGFVHPGFQNLVFTESTMQVPLPFKMELLNGRSIELLAKNNAAVGVDVAGMLLGYQEELTTWKQWGSTPASGVG